MNKEVIEAERKSAIAGLLATMEFDHLLNDDDTIKIGVDAWKTKVDKAINTMVRSYFKVYKRFESPVDPRNLKEAIHNLVQYKKYMKEIHLDDAISEFYSYFTYQIWWRIPSNYDTIKAVTEIAGGVNNEKN